jgi:hypothetical protein
VSNPSNFNGEFRAANFKSLLLFFHQAPESRFPYVDIYLAGATVPACYHYLPFNNLVPHFCTLEIFKTNGILELVNQVALLSSSMLIRDSESILLAKPHLRTRGMNMYQIARLTGRIV